MQHLNTTRFIQNDFQQVEKNKRKELIKWGKEKHLPDEFEQQLVWFHFSLVDKSYISACWADPLCPD